MILDYQISCLGGYEVWTPHIPVVLSPYSKTYVSEFRGQQQVIWLMVNRDTNTDEIVELELNGLNSPSHEQWFDLYHGIKLENLTYNENKRTTNILMTVEANGYGAVLVTLENVPGTYSHKCNSFVK